MPSKKPSTEPEKKSASRTTARSNSVASKSALRSAAAGRRRIRAKSAKGKTVKTAKAGRSESPSVRTSTPSTIARSDRHAQSLWRKALASAEKTYGDGARAHRVAYAALKHEYEKSGNRWARKAVAGPSDAQAARGPTTRPRSTDKSARTGRRHVIRKPGSPAELHAKSSGR